MRRKYSSEDLIDLTRKVIHLFVNKQFEAFRTYISEDFVWIGDTNMLYLTNSELINRNVEAQEQMPSVQLAEEEYRLLAHERSLWVTYGRYVAHTELADGTVAATKVHFTMTWQRKEDTVKLIHAMACHIPDYGFPIEEQQKKTQFFSHGDFNRLSDTPVHKNEKKLALSDSAGTTHYIYPSELLYVKANGTYCTFYTTHKQITCHMKLSDIAIPVLEPVHKSYLVNPAYITELRRFVLTLQNGTQLPVSRMLYTNFKKSLYSNTQDDETTKP